MIRDPRHYRDTAMNALASLVGDNGKERFFARVPKALMLTQQRLAIAAGDESHALDPFALKAFAIEQNTNVVATWTDPMLSGHTFEIDVVLTAKGDAVHYPSLRLWVKEKRGAYLVGANGDGAVIAIDTRGVTPVGKPPYRSKADRMLGIATGQTLLQRLTFAGSPYATPNPRNFAR
jgi:hypothetical protein